MSVKVLGLDGSFTCTGYACIKGLEADDIVDAGRIRGLRSNKPLAERVAKLTGEVLELIGEHRPDVVISEWPDLKVRSQKRGKSKKGGRDNGQGSARCGFMQGALYEAIRFQFGDACKLVVAESTLWSPGVGKDARHATLRMLYLPDSKSWPDLDDGGDMQDALGLARWGWREHVEKGLA